MKTATQKGKETKIANTKKILDVCGYEIWRDPNNFTTVKDGKNLYFSTFKNALVDIRQELIRNKLAGSDSLTEAINRIMWVDSRFMEGLSKGLEGLQQAKSLKDEGSIS